MGKTGSSSLQSWLSLNSQALARQGIGYADLAPQAKRGKISSGNGQPLWQAFRNGNLDEVKQLLQEEYCPANGNDIAIVSCELLQHLPRYQIRLFRDLCAELNIEVTIILFVRSAYEHCYSKYGQSVKRDGASHAFGEGKTDLTGWLALDRIVNYSRIFLDNLQILNYDDTERDVFTAFSAITGIDITRTEPLSARVNRSLTFGELQILRQVNALHGGTFATAISDHLIETFPEREPKILYDSQLLAQLRTEHGTDVEWINRHFAVTPPLVVDHFSGREGGVTQEDNDSTWAAIVAWARKFKPPRQSLGEFAALLSALADQVVDAGDAAALAKKARRYRSRSQRLPAQLPGQGREDATGQAAPRRFLITYFTPEPDKKSAELSQMHKDLVTWSLSIKKTTVGAIINPIGRAVYLNGDRAPETELNGDLPMSGYTILESESLESATEVARRCPVLSIGGRIQVREITPLRGA